MRTYLIIFIVAFLVACSESVKPVDTAVENQILYIGNGCLLYTSDAADE